MQKLYIRCGRGVRIQPGTRIPCKRCPSQDTETRFFPSGEDEAYTYSSFQKQGKPDQFDASVSDAYVRSVNAAESLFQHARWKILTSLTSFTRRPQKSLALVRSLFNVLSCAAKYEPPSSFLQVMDATILKFAVGFCPLPATLSHASFPTSAMLERSSTVRSETHVSTVFDSGNQKTCPK